MLLFFGGYEDELFYSMVSRYHRRSRNGASGNTIEDLFGARHLAVSVEFPTKLENLCSKLSEHSLITAESLIERHSLLPLFRPFLQKERLHRLMAMMVYDEENPHPYALLGLSTGPIHQPSHLKYCKSCYEEDTKKNGEPFWHRSHQVTGVFVCSKHNEWLEVSDVPMTSTVRGSKLCDIASSIDLDQRTDCSKLEPLFDKYKIYADMVEWVLANPTPVLGVDGLQRRYLERLNSIGLLTVGGQVRKQELMHRILTFWGSDFLSNVGLTETIKYGERNIRKILLGISQAVHPFFHFLLIGMLTSSPNEFFYGHPIARSFGSGPWKCLNGVCSHYKSYVIHEYSRSPLCPDGRIRGVFSCPKCGFTDLRDVDTHENKYLRVKSYGHVWWSELKHLNDAGSSLKEMSVRLNVGQRTVRQKLKEADTTGIVEDFLCCRQDFRQAWTSHLDLPSSACPAKIQRWLYYNDHEWYTNENKAHRAYAAPIAHRVGVDWQGRDEKLSKKIHETAMRLYNQQNHPVRVTMTSIGKAAGILSHLKKYHSQLPLVTMVLGRWCESTEVYNVRKVKMAAARLRKDKKPYTKWSLLDEARISRSISQNVLNQVSIELDNLKS